jgi:hypothetical protein
MSHVGPSLPPGPAYAAYENGYQALDFIHSWDDDLASYREAQIARKHRTKAVASGPGQQDGTAPRLFPRTIKGQHLYAPNSATTVSAILSGSNSPT